MSIANAITSAQNKVAAAYTSCNNMGATMPVPADQNLSNLPATIESIPKGGDEDGLLSDVMFYDYDGTVLYSYTKEEFMALAEMPANPSRPGLTAQGWNWTLAEAQDYVSKYGACDIGQMYVTDDGKTRLYLEIDGEEPLEITLRWLASRGQTEIDWGDGSELYVHQESQDYATKTTTHSYLPGHYILSIDPTTSSVVGLGNGSEQGDSSILLPREAIRALTKIEAGRKTMILRLGCIRNTNPLRAISTSTTTVIQTTIGVSSCGLRHLTIPRVSAVYSLQQMYGLRSVSLPPTAASLEQRAFYFCRTLRRCCIPPNVSTIPIDVLSYTDLIEEVIIPEAVTTLLTNSFINMTSLRTITMHPPVPPTIPAQIVSYDVTIYVPAEALEDYKAATNWSAYANHIYPITD